MFEYLQTDIKIRIDNQVYQKQIYSNMKNYNKLIHTYWYEI